MTLWERLTLFSYYLNNMNWQTCPIGGNNTTIGNVIIPTERVSLLSKRVWGIGNRVLSKREIKLMPRISRLYILLSWLITFLSDLRKRKKIWQD